MEYSWVIQPTYLSNDPKISPYFVIFWAVISDPIHFPQVLPKKTFGGAETNQTKTGKTVRKKKNCSGFAICGWLRGVGVFLFFFPTKKFGEVLEFFGGQKNYFTSSDPHHDMLGGGCQVRVVIENMMGRMENLRTLISGFLGLVILVRWALVTMFLSWTTQTGCRIHRTYVSLIGSGEGRHTTHLLKCVPLLSTSQTDWKQSSDVLSDISFDILSDISSDIFFWHIFWHSFWHIFWHSFWHLSDISSDIFFWHIFCHSFWHIFWHSFWHLSDISFDILSDKSFDTLSDISSDISFHMLSDISSDILSDISKPKPNIHSFTQKAALQTLYLPHTTQQK